MRLKLAFMMTVALVFSLCNLAAASEQVLFTEGFEAGDEALAPGWTVFSGETMARTTEMALNGKYAFYIDDPTNTAGLGVRSPHIPAEAGKEYAASAFVYVKAGTAQIYLEFFDEAGKRLDTQIVGAYAKPEWQQITARKVAPAGTKSVTALLYGHKGNVGMSIYDDVTLSVIN